MRFGVVVTVFWGFLLLPVSGNAVDGDCVNSGCHASFGKEKTPHEALDNCSDCHTLNSGSTAANHGKSKPAKTDYGLIKQSPDLCFDCHDSDAEKTDTLHTPYEDGECLTCHNPHGSNHLAMLKVSVKDTCLDCHDEIAEELEKARFEHDPLDSEEACTECHRSHGGDSHKFLKKPTVIETCNECHDDLVGPITEAPANHRHGPIQKGECQGCHNPHGSPYIAMLRGNYPAGQYAAYSEAAYKGCFGKCHDPKMFSEKGETGFRDDKQNLHFLHVNRIKGRSCRLCHEPHFAAGEHLIKTTVPFGTWTFDMGWERGAEATTAGCSPGCHAEKKYNKAAPLPVKAQGEVPKRTPAAKAK